MSSKILFFFFIPFLSIVLLLINLILATHNPYSEKKSPFECGFSSFLFQNRTQFNISFFIFALLFLLFDLEILLIYPYAVSSDSNKTYGLVIMLVFFVLLTIGFIFELGKNALSIFSKQYKVGNDYIFSYNYLLILSSISGIIMSSLITITKPDIKPGIDVDNPVTLGIILGLALVTIVGFTWYKRRKSRDTKVIVLQLISVKVGATYSPGIIDKNDPSAFLLKKIYDMNKGYMSPSFKEFHNNLNLEWVKVCVGNEEYWALVGLDAELPIDFYVEHCIELFVELMEKNNISDQTSPASFKSNMDIFFNDLRNRALNVRLAGMPALTVQSMLDQLVYEFEHYTENRTLESKYYFCFPAPNWSALNDLRKDQNIVVLTGWNDRMSTIEEAWIPWFNKNTINIPIIYNVYMPFRTKIYQLPIIFS